MNNTPVRNTSRLYLNDRAFTMVELIVVCVIIGILGLFIFPAISCGCSPSGVIKRNVDGTNLRSIGQAMLAYTQDNADGLLPAAGANDVHDVAANLARSGLNVPSLWVSKVDLNYPANMDGITQIIVATGAAAKDTAPTDPKFQSLPLAFAVAGFPPGTDITKLPGSTPLAWTRGLSPSGEWLNGVAPYNDWGGFIVFAGGNLEKFKTIDGKLVKFGTTQPTSDIREALPPGTRILESPSRR